MLDRGFLDRLRVVAIVVAISCSERAGAIDFGSGPLPLRYVSSKPVALAADHELRIVGEVRSAAPVVVVLRVDDAMSSDYASRYNEERTLPPGPFEWTVPAGGMLSPSGRVLVRTDLRRFHLFAAGSRSARIDVTEFGSVPVRKLPAGAVGYALGYHDAPLPPGFGRIAPGDYRIRGTRVTAVRRSGPDPLVASGIRGVATLKVAWTQARARVTIWSEDPGDWEYLPHVLEQRVRINGRDVSMRSRTSDEWLKERYLDGARAEHSSKDDAWSAYGNRRGGTITAVVDALDNAITVELAGPSPDSLFLNAILIEPETSSAASEQVRSWRQRWYRQMWPVLQSKDEAVGLIIGLKFPQDVSRAAREPVKQTGAAGTGVRFRLRVSSDVVVGAPEVTIDPPQLGGRSAVARVWSGQWRLERLRANDTSLMLADNMLTGEAQRLPILPSQVRNYEIWIDIPSDANAGLWLGAISIGQGNDVVRVPLGVEVLPLKLPHAAKPAGFYLDEAPHLTWFAALKEQRKQQIECDLALMGSFGLEGSAPALATPSPANRDFETDMRSARDAGVASPWLAYAPAKRMAARDGQRGSAIKLAELEKVIAKDGIAPPIWSVADEPSNPGHVASDLLDWVKEIRAAAPSLTIAAHLNSPSEIRYASRFDVVLVNDGFGLDLPVLERLRRQVKGLWLYNTSRPRATAGLWLWRSPASRYIQWHARMPTADPYDPTDGREGDVQVIYPSIEACPAKPVIHRDLLEMAEGIVDQRWLLWLSGVPGADAENLRMALRSRFGTWEKVRDLDGRELAAIRESIIEIAKNRGGK